MFDIRLLFWSLAGLGFGSWLFYKGFIWRAHLRMIRDTPTSKVRSIAMGPVEVYGSVKRADELLQSPFSHTECTYYKYTVEKYVHTKNGGHWRKIKEGSACTPFYLEDDTGAVLVDCTGAEVNIPMDNEFGSANAIISNFLDFKPSFFSGTRRYREYFLAPNDKVYVLGTAGKNPFVKEGTARDSVENVLIQKGPKKAFFYVSDCSEEFVVSKFKWKVFGGLVGGGLLIVGSLFFLFINLGWL